MLVVPLLFATVQASVSLYFHNAAPERPNHGVLTSESLAVMANQFIGLPLPDASFADIETANLVPSVLLDSNNAAVVVFTDFNADTAESLLGSPVFTANEPQDETAMKVDKGSVPHGPVARLAISQIDKREFPVLLVNASGFEKELLDSMAHVKSKVLIMGVPAGGAVPKIAYTRTVELEQHFGLNILPGEASSRAKSSKKLKSLPSSFASKEECKDQTGDCSGRGSCIALGERYVCACKATKKGGYTYRWGGPACNKRDVSWQFNLLFWSTIGIVVAVSAVIKLLFSVGSDPLPGILNSGQPDLK